MPNKTKKSRKSRKVESKSRKSYKLDCRKKSNKTKSACKNKSKKSVNRKKSVKSKKSKSKSKKSKSKSRINKLKGGVYAANPTNEETEYHDNIQTLKNWIITQSSGYMPEDIDQLINTLERSYKNVSASRSTFRKILDDNEKNRMGLVDQINYWKKNFEKYQSQHKEVKRELFFQEDENTKLKVENRKLKENYDNVLLLNDELKIKNIELKKKLAKFVQIDLEQKKKDKK